MSLEVPDTTMKGSLFIATATALGSEKVQWTAFMRRNLGLEQLRRQTKSPFSMELKERLLKASRETFTSTAASSSVAEIVSSQQCC